VIVFCLDFSSCGGSDGDKQEEYNHHEEEKSSKSLFFEMKNEVSNKEGKYSFLL